MLLLRYTERQRLGLEPEGVALDGAASEGLAVHGTSPEIMRWCDPAGGCLLKIFLL